MLHSHKGRHIQRLSGGDAGQKCLMHADARPAIRQRDSAKATGVSLSPRIATHHHASFSCRRSPFKCLEFLDSKPVSLVPTLPPDISYLFCTILINQHILGSVHTSGRLRVALCELAALLVLGE
jgi:hypothetical protein